MRLSERAWQIVTALSMTAGRGPLARAVADAAELTPADRVVDIGCGPGTAVRHAARRGAARRGAAATGVDPDPAMLRLARWITALRRPPDVSWLEGRAEKLPLPDDQATVVWAISSAHHWEDRGTGIGEAWRVLAPGGRLVLAERLPRPATGPWSSSAGRKTTKPEPGEAGQRQVGLAGQRAMGRPRSAQEGCTAGAGDPLERGAGELLDLGWQGHVAVRGGVGLSGVGEPVEHGDQDLPAGLVRLAGVDQRPAVPADRVAGGAGLVDDGEAGRGDAGFPGGVGGDGLGRWGDVVPGLVADGGERQQQALGVRLLDVADGERGAVHRRGHPGVAFFAVPGRPGQRRAGADSGGPGRVDTGQVVAEDVGGAAAVGAVRDGDRRVREGGAGVEGGDGRVVPAGDLPEEDGCEHRARQVQPGACREAEVAGRPFAAQGDGHLPHRASAGGCLLAGGHGDVGGAEVDLPGAERGDARAAAYRGVADGHTRVLLLVPGEGGGEERRVECGAGPGKGARMVGWDGAGRGRRRRRAARGAGGGRAGARAKGE